MTAFFALLRRDLRLGFRQGIDALVVVLFFLAAGALFPFALGPEPALLARLAAGIVMTMAALASLLSLDRLFSGDYEDGSLDGLALSPLSLELVALAKVATHWLMTGLPLRTARSSRRWRSAGSPTRSRSSWRRADRCTTTTSRFPCSSRCSPGTSHSRTALTQPGWSSSSSSRSPHSSASSSAAGMQVGAPGGIPAVATVVVVALAFWLRPEETTPVVPQEVAFAEVESIIAQRCATCHFGAGAPLGVKLETREEIEARIDDIQRMAVQTDAMPPGNQTGMTDDERALLASWIAQNG